jgi:hypothetical protein
MTDSTQTELDGVAQLIATYLEGLHNPSDNYLYNELRAIRDTENLKRAIIAYTNKRIEEVLDRLETQALELPLSNGREMYLVDVSAIEAERNKLKEES